MRFLVIEGLDGSGKSTQVRLLSDHLEKQGVSFRYLHFPRLEEGVYGELIARFLRGEMGDNDRVDPYLVALIFAGDRADASSMICRWMEEGYLVIADRYVYSNIAFQCAKLSDPSEQKRLRDWILELEYGHHGIPRPDAHVYLDVPFDFITSQLSLARLGSDRAYLKGAKDIHEEDLIFQEKVRQHYLALREAVNDLHVIGCTDPQGNMMPPEEISGLIVEQMELSE